MPEGTPFKLPVNYHSSILGVTSSGITKQIAVRRLFQVGFASNYRPQSGVVKVVSPVVMVRSSQPMRVTVLQIWSVMQLYGHNIAVIVLQGHTECPGHKPREEHVLGGCLNAAITQKGCSLKLDDKY